MDGVTLKGRQKSDSLVVPMKRVMTVEERGGREDNLRQGNL